MRPACTGNVLRTRSVLSRRQEAPADSSRKNAADRVGRLRDEGCGGSPWKRRRSRRQPARLCALLVGVRGLVERGLVERSPHQLEADRQPARGEAAWDRERWKAGECRHQAVASGCSLREEGRFMVEARIQEGIEALLGHDLHNRRAQRLANPQLLEKDWIVRALSYVVA